MQGKLAIFARVERFAQLIAKHDGGTLLVNSTLAIFSRPEDKEDFELAGQQRAALTQGIEALGTIAPFLAPATFAPAIPVVLASLETLQNRACLVCIEQLAHDESNIASIFKINDRDVAFSVEDSKWKIQIDPATGREYYVNEETRESMWIKPVELGVAERMGKIGDLDTIGTILQMLREGGDDPETSIPACVSSQPIFSSSMHSFSHAAAFAPPLPPPHCCRYETLATLSLTPVAVQAIRDKGGVELTNDWLSYNMGKVQHFAASTAALQMLARIGAQDPDTFSALIDDGKIETVCSSMYACETITPKFVAGFEALIEVSVTERPTFAAEFVHNGRMRQLVELYGGDDNRAEMLCTDPASALGFIELAVQMGQHGELKGLMQDEGVPQVRRSRFMLLSLVVYVRVLFVPFLSFPFYFIVPGVLRIACNGGGHIINIPARYAAYGAAPESRDADGGWE